MENITTIQGKLLYLARQMHAENAINKKEQSVFKGNTILTQTLSLLRFLPLSKHMNFTFQKELNWL